jgi:flagellar hook assembly protein FlgD
MFNDVSLKIYDNLGKEVAMLVNEKQNEGSYSVEFYGTNYPSGIYYYKLEAGDFSEVRKMILLK